MDNFYMILPSNVTSEEYFPQNTIANFITKVPERVSLSGEWEVGLAEISYTYSWFNVPVAAKFKLQLLDDKNKYTEIPGELPKGHYPTVDSLIDSLNQSIAKLVLTLKATMPSVFLFGNRVHISCGKDIKNRGVFLLLDTELSGMLSLDMKPVTAKVVRYLTTVATRPNFDVPKEIKMVAAKNVPDIMRGVYSLFLYCDCIKPTFVGNTFSQVLRVIEIPGKAILGSQVNIKYSGIFYVPLSINEFETIELQLKDSVGDNIAFQYGRVIATLHFRQKR